MFRCVCARRLRVAWAACAVLSFMPPAAHGQAPSLDTYADVQAVREYVQSQIQGLEGTNDADAALMETYGAILTQLQQADDAEKRTTDFRGRSESAPAEIAALSADGANAQAVEAPALGPDASLPDFEQQLGKAKDELAGARSRLEALQARQKERADRRTQLPTELSKAHEQSEAAKAAAASPAEEGVPPPVVEARRLAAQATVLAREAEIRALRAELDTFDILDQRNEAEIEVLSQEVVRRESVVAAVQEAVDKRRIAEADKAAAEARSAVLQAANAGAAVRDAVQRLAEENRALATLRTGPDGLPAKTAEAERRNGEVQALNQQVSGDLATLRKKQEAGEVGGAFGLLLHRYRATLPDPAAYRRRVRQVEQDIGRANLMQLEFEQGLRELRNLDAAVERMLADSAPSLEAGQRRRLERLVRDLLQSKRDYLTALRQDCGNYLDVLLALNVQQKSLADTLESFEAYIGENVLWVRSGDVIGRNDLAYMWEALQWFADPASWQGVGRTLWTEAKQYPLRFGLAVTLLLGLLGFQPRVRRHLNAMGEQAAKPNCTSIRPTLLAALDLVLMTLPIPAFLGYLGWVCAQSLNATDFARAAGLGLQVAALLMGAFSAVRRVARPLGLAEAHFGWPRANLRSIRTQLLWAGALINLCYGLIYTLEAQDNEAWKHGLGRAMFLLAMAAAVLLVHLNARANGAVVNLVETRFIQRRIRLRPLWHALLIIVPLALVVLAVMGYYYTALRLAARLFASVGLGLAALLAAAVVLRWLLVARRGVALEQARKRRAAAKEGGDGTVPVDADVELLDISKIGEQTRRLVRGFAVVGLLAALWFVWASDMPALGRLNSLPLWTGAPVTVGDVAMGLLIGAVTLMAVRNVPGFMEIAVLQRMSLGGGERYAIRTLVSYAIGAAGIMLSLQYFGVTWSKLQWLVAAMGVGLGFGLQEIFANFVSGLIILFERPIRVGDIVTVGDISGSVTRIRIRATTILSGDRKELIVPNKEFISNKLINWTLTDTTLRLVIRVGVAHGSDTDKVVGLLLRKAKEHPQVLEDPPPQAAFVGLGDSALQFELRVFTPNPEAHGQAQHDLFMSIVQAFRDEGIEIAFPQLDVHVRSVESGAYTDVTPSPPESHR